MEANPGTFETQRFAAFAQAGVTRLSIGVQSFSDDALRALGRVHDSRQARAAIEEAARSFASFNLDLMHALPGQTLDRAARRPGRGAGVRPAAPVAVPPDDRAEHALREAAPAVARRRPVGGHAGADRGDAGAAGFERYEVSAWARAGARCRHNLNYWEFGDYLGIGAGAHGKLSSTGSCARHVAPPRRTMEAAPAARRSRSASRCGRTAFEFMLNALRLTDGYRRRSSPSAPGCRRRRSADCAGRSSAACSMRIRRASAPRRWACVS